jgi:hypothetical protein
LPPQWRLLTRPAKRLPPYLTFGVLADEWTFAGAAIIV